MHSESTRSHREKKPGSSRMNRVFGGRVKGKCTTCATSSNVALISLCYLQLSLGLKCHNLHQKKGQRMTLTSLAEPPEGISNLSECTIRVHLWQCPSSDVGVQQQLESSAFSRCARNSVSEEIWPEQNRVSFMLSIFCT